MWAIPKALKIFVASFVVGSTISVTQAATFLVVNTPASGGSSDIHGINDTGQITGAYLPTVNSDANEQGFVGPINGPYQMFQFVGEPGKGTEPRAINNDGWITGIFSSQGGSCVPVSTFKTCRGFVRQPGGFAQWITKKIGRFPLLGTGQGINSTGAIVGEYITDEASTVRLGYQGSVKSGAKNTQRVSLDSDVTLQFITPCTAPTRVAPRGINSQGDIVGFFRAYSKDQGFLKRNGHVWALNIPQAGNQGTYPQSINDKGEISGNWSDSTGISHGFVLSADLRTWTKFDPQIIVGTEKQTLVKTQGWQINNYGQIAVTASTSINDGTGMSFVYCPAAGPNGCAGTIRRGKEMPGDVQTLPAEDPPIDKPLGCVIN